MEIDDSASCDSPLQENSVTNSKHAQNTPTLERTTPDGLLLIRQDLAYKGIRREIGSIVMNSWRNTTRNKYASILQQLEKFCIERKINPLRGSLTDGLQFMSLKKDQGSKYGVLNNIRCALSTVFVMGEIPFEQYQIACRFVKGTYQNKPPTSKYDFIWDPDVLLTVLKNMGPNSELIFQDNHIKWSWLHHNVFKYCL